MINNLSQLKKAIQNQQEFKIIKHSRPYMIGQIRKPNIIQTNGFYSIIPDALDDRVSISNGGRGSWLAFGKASHWEFNNGLCTKYLSDTHNDDTFIWTIEFIQ